VPTLARVREGFALQVSPGEVESAFEVPLAFLMALQNYKRQQAQWNQLSTSVSAIQFEDDNIWGVTAGILRNLLRADLQRLILIGGREVGISHPQACSSTATEEVRS
jgi:hypothetical protein